MPTSSATSRETQDRLISSRIDQVRSTTREVITTSESDTASMVRGTNSQQTNHAYALAARVAGRINAASISDDEHQALLDERRALLDKKFAGNMSRKDQNRLNYVRWSLDRIEDAKNGFVLDALESAVAQYEQLHDDIQNFRLQLEQHLPKK